jgi:transposase-like protein
MNKSKPKQYSRKFKQRVVEEVLTGKYTQAEARRIYGIKSKSGILEWIRVIHGQERRPKTIKKLTEMQKDLKEESLRRRIEELEKELRIEKHKSLLYEKLVEVAEEELGIEIKKKSGAKQSQELKRRQNLR